jgi:Tfp pilus assembly protein PilO
MTTMNTAMTENMAKMEAADVARRANEDSEQAGNKSDMEMKHAMIAQLQAMSDQIKQLDERITALSAQLETATAKPVKTVKAKPAAPAVRPPIKPVY